MFSDAELVARTLRGDRGAFDGLVQRHYALVRRIAYRYVLFAEDVHDLVQETFVTAYTQLGQLAHPEAFAGWLAAIARNEGLMWRRRAMAQPDLAGTR